MYFTKLAILALVGTAAAAPVLTHDGTNVACSNSQSTVCCDKAGKNCQISGMSGTVHLPRTCLSIRRLPHDRKCEEEEDVMLT